MFVWIFIIGKRIVCEFEEIPSRKQWIHSGVLSTFGNMSIGIISVCLLKRLRNARNRYKKTTQLYRILAINLSVADLLVGVSVTLKRGNFESLFQHSYWQLYVVCICKKSIEVEGQYCLVDHEWRGGAWCSAAGVLVVVGSEESVLLMVLITVVRMTTTFRLDLVKCSIFNY